MYCLPLFAIQVKINNKNASVLLVPACLYIQPLQYRVLSRPPTHYHQAHHTVHTILCTMSGTYLVLPSNSSMSYFPDNTLADFRTKLPQPLHITNEPHEVALTELIFPYTFQNAEYGDLYAIIDSSKSQAKEPAKAHPWILLMNGDRKSKHIMDAGSYYEPTGLLLEFNRVMKPAHLVYNQYRNRFKLVFPAELSITLSRPLALIIGFLKPQDTVQLFQLNKTQEAWRPPTFNMGYNALFVYSDIVEYQIVGDHMAPLLRTIVPGPGAGDGGSTNQAGTVISEKFMNPYYMPISLLSTDVIRITIRTIEGKRFPFTTGSGHVIAKLHIRPRRAY